MPPNDINKSLKKIKIHFILDPSYSSEDESSSGMQECYEECVSNKLLVDWVKDPMDPKHKFTKNHIFVFEKFSGDFYDKIVSSGTCFRVVGPYCLFTCMNKSLPIPQVPTLTMAMDQLIISFSCLSKEIKADLTNKVKLMGGVVTSSLLETTTHLVVGKACSPKYEKANERAMKVMTAGWIDAVFTASQHSGLTHANDYDFAKYKCPVFYNLAFSKAIESHGGSYYGTLQYQVTDILICEKSEGDKYNAAREWGLPCVMGHWVTDSVDAGYSLPFSRYAVPGNSAIKCSTPTKDELPSKFHNSDISISMIQEHSHPLTHPKTLPPTPSSASYTTQHLTPTAYDYARAVESLDLLLAKRSEAFLDGCNIYLTGFDSGQEEKLRRIIKLGSGVRFTEPDDSVTHVVLGAFTPTFHKLYGCLSSKPHVVTVEWLKQSMLSKSPAPETPYLCFPTKPVSSALGKGVECPSPLSKKGLQMLISPAKPRPSPVKTRNSPAARKLLQGYLDSQQASQQPPDIEPQPLEAFKLPDRPSQTDIPVSEEPTGSNPECFTGLMFLVLGFPEDETSEIVQAIREASGKVVTNPKTFHGIPDYVIVPFEGYATSVVPTEDIVTDIWLMECKQQSSVVEVQYYHRPAQVLSCATPLVNCVITISNYVGFERDFLAKLSQLLGAGYQEEFMKRDNPKNNKKASTHLVCPTCSGSKYNAALKWGFPSVNKKWLLECARTGKRVSEQQYLTGSDEASQNVGSQNGVGSQSNGFGLQQNIGSHNGVGSQTNGVQSRLNGARSDAKPNEPDRLDTKENHTSSRENPEFESASQGSQLLGKSASKKRKLCLLNNGDGEGLGSPVKRTALDSKHSPVKQSQNSSFSQGKPTREERKQWEKLMDNLVSDEPAGRMLPPKTTKLSANNKVEAWVNENELLAQARTPNSGQRTTNNSERTPSQNNPSSQRIANNPSNERTPSQTNISSQAKSSQASQPSDLVKTIDELNQQLSRAKSRTSRDSDETNSPPKRNSVHARKYVQTGENSAGEKCFVLSNVSDDLKVRYCEIVDRLGGNLLNTSQCFQPQTTHLIMESPLRSEKLLCCLASGKWILTPRYLEDSAERKMFLPEQEYEFGNPFSANKMPRLDGQLVQYAQAAYRWRLKQGGAFRHMKATLYVSDKRVDSLRRLIQAGGGQVLDDKDALQGTHCFWEDSRVDMPLSLEDFARAGVYLLPPVYLADYLRQEPPPQPQDCLIPVYKPLYENASR
ncbi:hypothetical protein M8J75_013007 [Diaphorina citri]|nr:hypothetical protein M8J75_013007 [Diaphorina citri]